VLCLKKQQRIAIHALSISFQWPIPAKNSSFQCASESLHFDPLRSIITLMSNPAPANTAFSAKSIAASVDSLYSFPDVATNILNKLKDDQTGIQDIGELVQQDVALTAAVLRLGNNAANMQMDGAVTDVKRALARVGGKQLEELVYGICIPQATANMQNDVIELQDFWKHSLFTAVIAQQLATKVRRVAPSTAFTAGLLHDLGQLALFRVFPVESKTAARNSALEDIDMSAAEMAIFGFSHEDVGRELCEQWGLPEQLTRCVTTHHNPDIGEHGDKLVMITHIASTLAEAAETEEDPIECLAECNADILEALFDDPIDPVEIIETGRAQYEEMRSSIIPSN